MSTLRSMTQAYYSPENFGHFGLALGQGVGVDQAMKDIGQVVEGYRNTKEVHLLAQRMNVEMPIVDQVYQVLYQGKDAKLAASDLLSRERKVE